MKAFITMLAVSLALVQSGICADTSKQEVQFSNLPSNIQKTITDHTNGGTVDKIEKTTEKGKTKYCVQAHNKGTEMKFKVDSKGKYLGEDLMHPTKDQGNELPTK